MLGNLEVGVAGTERKGPETGREHLGHILSPSNQRCSCFSSILITTRTLSPGSLNFFVMCLQIAFFRQEILYTSKIVFPGKKGKHNLIILYGRQVLMIRIVHAARVYSKCHEVWLYWCGEKCSSTQKILGQIPTNHQITWKARKCTIT